MTDRDGIQFEIGAAFPPDSILARWMTGCLMALNDLLLVNRWLVPRLDGEIESEGYERLYLARLASSHLFEAATFLQRGHRHAEIRSFVAGLDPQAREDYAGLLRIAKGENGEFTDRLQSARNNFSHYGKLLFGEAAMYENLRRAMQGHAADGTIGQIRDKVPPKDGFRALFADDIAAEMTFPGDDEEATRDFVREISEHMALCLRFGRSALGAYAASLPKSAWEDWTEDTPANRQ